MKKILIFEDDKVLVRVYANKLKKAGYNVLFQENGTEALERVKKEKPDLIISDLIMPEKDGFETLEEIKANEDTKHIPTLIVSNLGQEADRKETKKLGATEHLVKANVSFKEIQKKIKELLS